MPLRPRLALLTYLAIIGTAALALALTAVPFREELLTLGFVFIIGAPVSFGIGLLAGLPADREAEAIRASARSELRASVRRFGEALRSTSIATDDASGEPDLAPLFRLVLETAISAVQGRSGIVYRFDRAHDRLQPVGAAGCPMPPVLRLDEGIAGWIAAHRVSLRLPSGRIDVPEPASGEPTDRAVIGVPLEVGDELLGVLLVHGRRRSGKFSDEDLEALSALGRQASIGADNVLLHHEAKRLSVTDALTGIANYRAFRERLTTEFERAVRFGRPLSLVIADIDRFKDVNDRFGHQRGDLVLAEVAARMTGATRTAIDLVARYGGEEFALILPETDPAGAAAVADKIRMSAAEAPFAGGDQHVHATISAGYATFPMHARDPEALIQAADLALYEAKRKGRNRIAQAASSPADESSRT